MSIRYENPEVIRLEISRGDWLLVKKRLTAGESRRMFARMLNGNSIEPVNVGLSKMVTYLIDWSIQGLDGKIVPIVDKDDAAKSAAFDNLPEDDFREILQAIEAHEARVEAERDAIKNSPDGATTSSPISPSADTSTGGGTSGRKRSTRMSIAS